MKSTIELNLCPGSSNIIGYGYDVTSATLAIRFKSGAPGGNTYHYAGVPAALYLEFSAADSKGKFFAAHIKNASDLYPVTLMSAEEPDDDEGDIPVPQPTPKPAPEAPKEKEAA